MVRIIKMANDKYIVSVDEGITVNDDEILNKIIETEDNLSKFIEELLEETKI